MTLIINHRVNTIELLKNTPSKYGVEIDIRSNSKDLILHHDAFSEKHELFHDWIQFFNHKFLILNVKEEGLEQYVFDLITEYHIQDFFFLDQSFPFLVKTSNAGESRSALRFSEYESIETVLAMTGKIDWVWIDHFTKFPLDFHHFTQLYEAHFKLCLVSPELQGFSCQTRLNLIQYLKSNQIRIDAVCTKFPNEWEAL